MSKKKWSLVFLFSIIVWLLYKLSDVKTGHQNEDPKENSRYFETDEKIEDLKDKVKVLCWIMTIPDNLQTRAIAVKETWAPHCNKYVFVSGVGNKTFPVVELDIVEGRYHLSNKTYTSLSYLYKHHRREYDWFLKADDDTYVVVENLRYILNSFDPNRPLLIGRKLKTVVPNGYMSGGAGYVLSRRALELIVTKGVHNKTLCPIWSMEDVDIGRCATNVGVSHVDSSADVYGKERFHPIYLSEYFKPHFDTWMFIYSLAKVKSGAECCSNVTISIHNVKPEQMYMIHFLLYHMEVHGEIPRWPKQFPVS